jgi:secreted PhoX family phosphatase
MNELAPRAAYTDGDVDTNRSNNPTLESIVAARYSRRHTLLGGLSAATMAVFGGALLSACGDDEDNTAPTVSAGENASTSSGRLVTLTGTANDEDGILSSSWTQVSGPTVTLSDPNSATTTFIAPSVAAATPLTFRYTARDFRGSGSSADSTVTVSPATLGFTAVPKNRNDVVTVPEGYTVAVLYALGDPIAAGVPGYANNGTDTNFAGRIGDHGDALHYFGLNAEGTGRSDSSSTRGLLAQNFESITPAYLHPAGPTNVGGVRPEAEALKEIEAHGVGIVEISSAAGAWSYNPASRYNRRITPSTPMDIHGPVRGSAYVRTAYSPDGTRARGTINNCANGMTGWGTYLTCEENWAGYFRRPAAESATRTAIGGVTAKSVAGLARYGVTSSTGNYGWSTVQVADPGNTLFRRWDARVDQAAPADGSGDFRFEPHQFGWVVEIDPYDPASVPRKRTALGRFGHEGACPGLFVSGRRPAIYMGDDARGEYLYKFVSATPWNEADAAESNATRLATGDKYLDTGTLYVARFDEDGSGDWLPLVFGQGPLTATNAAYPFADQADVLVNTRLAADALGATRMDRPEWTAVNPTNGELYLTLTNNNASGRPVNGTNAANPRHYDDPAQATDEDNDPNATRSQVGNPNGHIIRLRESGDTTEATTFRWDIFAFGAGSDLDPANINLSRLDATNDFSSPDGLWFGRRSNASGLVTPILWIQTDDGAYTDVTNNQMLAAMPGTVGDGGSVTITNQSSQGTGTQTTFVGRTPGTSLRRFLVGPVECEVTGIDSTPDGRTIFVGIQHPGEDGTPDAPTSSWPATQPSGVAPAGTRPRSGTIVITKNDGGVVGL